MFNSFKTFIDLIFKGLGIVFIVSCFVTVIVLFKSCEGVVDNIDTKIERGNK